MKKYNGTLFFKECKHKSVHVKTWINDNNYCFLLEFWEKFEIYKWCGLNKFEVGQKTFSKKINVLPNQLVT